MGSSGSSAGSRVNASQSLPPNGMRQLPYLLLGMIIAHMATQGKANSIGKEAIPRARQAEMLAQGRPFVVAPKQAAALQLRNDARDEIAKRARQVGEHHGEAVAAFGEQPFLHRVRDRLRRA